MLSTGQRSSSTRRRGGRSAITALLLVAAALLGSSRLSPNPQTCSAAATATPGAILLTSGPTQPKSDCSTGPKIRFELSWSEAPKELVVEYNADGHGLGPTHPRSPGGRDSWDITLHGTVGFISLSAPQGAYVGFLKCRLSNPDTNEEYDTAEYFRVDGPLPQLLSGKWGIECHAPKLGTA